MFLTIIPKGLFHVKQTLLVSRRVKFNFFQFIKNTWFYDLWMYKIKFQNISNIIKIFIEVLLEKCMVNGEDILLKQHNFDNFIAVLLQQLVIHCNFNQAILFRRCYCGFLNLLA